MTAWWGTGRGEEEDGGERWHRTRENAPVGDGNSRRWNQLRGECTKLQSTQVIREIQGQHGERGAQRCLRHPGWGTEPK